MRITRYAWLLAGAVSLQGSAAFAGEGSSLRGLKPPGTSAEALSYTLFGSEPRGKRTADDDVPGFGARLLLSGGTFESRSFSLADLDYRFSLHQPMGARVSALAEPGATTLLDVVPRYTLHTQVTRTLPGGFGLGFGVRQTEYQYSTANLLAFSAERAFGSFRGAYTLFSNRTDGAALGSTHRFEVSYLYGERNSLGLSYTTGRDTDPVALPASMQVADVRDWTLSGRHWLSANWALTYDLQTQEQPLYRRQGLRLGVSRSF